MPEQLTLRLQAVIADEATRRSANVTLSASSTPAAPGVGRDVGAEPAGAMIPGRPDLPERTSQARQRRRPSAKTWTSPLLLRGLTATAVLVVLVGGGILLAKGRGPASSHSTARSAPASRPVRNRPSAAIVGSAATTPLRYRHDGEYVYANAVKSNANYTKAGLPDGVRSEVKNSAQVTSPAATIAPGGSAPAATHQFNGVTISHLESCLSAVTNGHLVQLVEVARYLGKPVTIIVLKPVHDIFDVIVVGHTCGISGQDVITRLTVPMR